jgi:ornithine cyclodeaminase/alanine dehydrogenase-like protein (mu-crystallin family)
MYTQVLFAFERVKELAPQHPEWKTTQPFKALLEGDMKTVGAAGTLSQILTGEILPRDEPDSISIFSPFGLGVLDLTLDSYAYEMAVEQKNGTKITSFFHAT